MLTNLRKRGNATKRYLFSGRSTRNEFPRLVISGGGEGVRDRKSAVGVKSVLAESGLLREAPLLRRTAVKYPRGAVRLARGLIRLSRTPPRAFSIHLNNGQAGNPLNRCALVP